MTALLKTVHTVYSLTICAFVVLIAGLFFVSNQIVFPQKISQTCIIPETISTNVVIEFSESVTSINCRHENVRIVEGGSLILKGAGSVKSPQLFVKSLVVDQGANVVAESQSEIISGDAVVSANPNVFTPHIIFAEYVQLQNQTITSQGKLSAEGNILAMNREDVIAESGEVLGVNSDQSMPIKPSIELTKDTVVEQASVSEGQNTPATTNNLAFIDQIMSCNGITSDPKDCNRFTLNVTEREKEDQSFDVVTAQYVSTEGASEASGNFSNANVLGVSGEILTSGSTISADGVVTLNVEVKPPKKLMKPQKTRIDFEVKRNEYEFDGRTGIYQSEVVLWDGKTPLIISEQLANLDKNAAYKWRARVVNTGTNESTDWFRHNLDSIVPDFYTSTSKSLHIEANKYTAKTDEALDLTISAIKADGSVDKDFVGMVKLSSDHPSTTLPKYYVFTKADQGKKVFPASVQFFEKGQSFITATAVDNPTLTATAAFTVNATDRDFLILKANKDHIAKGESVIISWVGSGINEVLLEGDSSPFLMGEQRTFNPETTQRFVINGRKSNGEIVNAAVTVVVGEVDNSITSVAQVTNQNPIDSGAYPVDIISQPGAYAENSIIKLPPFILPNDRTLEYSVPKLDPIITSRQPLSCPRIKSFQVSAPYAGPNSMVMVIWDVADTDKVFLDAVGGEVPSSGIASVQISSGRTVLGLKAVNGNCDKTEYETIEATSEVPGERSATWVVGLLGLELVAFILIPISPSGRKFNMFAWLETLLKDALGYRKYGIVYDYVSKQGIAGVRVALTDSNNDFVVSAMTNYEGEVWLRPLPAGNYHLSIERFAYKVYKPKTLISKDGYADIPAKGIFKIKSRRLSFFSIPMKPDMAVQDSAAGYGAFLSEEVYGVVIPLLLVTGMVYGAILSLQIPLTQQYIGYGLLCTYFIFKCWNYIAARPKKATVKIVSGGVAKHIILDLYDKKTNKKVTSTTTDNYGEYAFHVSPGKYYIKIRDQQYRLLGKHHSKNIVAVGSGASLDSVIAQEIIVYPAANYSYAASSV